MKGVAGSCALSLLIGACQSGAVAPQPALLFQGDQAAMERLIAALGGEMGRTSIDLGPSDPTSSPVISVLPVPGGQLNDRNLALPTLFRLERDRETCAVVREDNGRRIVLDGVACRAASQ